MTNTPMLGSLCSGIGGLDLAAEHLLGANLNWWSDIAPASQTVMSAHWPNATPLGDLTRIDWTTIPTVDILTAGYPCQPFSVAGTRGGADDPRHLWPHIAEAIRHLRPSLVILENVKGHLTLGFDQVLHDLAALGFDADWTIVRASDVGAPHRRERLFVAAYPAGTRGEGLHAKAGEASPQRHGQPRPRTMAPDWGRYADAIRRWETIHGPHPDPTEPGTNGRTRVAPAFVEWMMGFPPGWATNLIPTHTTALRALGNAVVPQQAVHALRHLAAFQLEPEPEPSPHLLPTPTVVDMGCRKTAAEWNQWTAALRDRHNNSNGHGRSLHQELTQLGKKDEQ